MSVCSWRAWKELLISNPSLPRPAVEPKATLATHNTAPLGWRATQPTPIGGFRLTLILFVRSVLNGGGLAFVDPLVRPDAN